jgi:Predicted phage phi-C31 gp36 major capsid-like protein
MVMQKQHVGRPPRENLVRAIAPGTGYEVRDAGAGQPVLAGHFAVFDEWTEVNSMWEGHFLERNAKGAFEKTIKSNRDRMKVTLNHGSDPDLGDKVLGTIDELGEDDRGVAYEVGLFPSVPPLVMEGLRAGVYGSSYRFRVLREEWVEEPGVSDHNPQGLPERTVKEAEVGEFGPVTFPQYEGATAGVRSLTDEYLFGELTADPKRLAAIIDYRRGLTTADIPTADKSKGDKPPKAESEPKPDETKEEQMPDIERFNTLELLAHRANEIRERFAYLHAEYAGTDLPPTVQTEWDELEEEEAAIATRRDHLRKREAKVAQAAEDRKGVEDADNAIRTVSERRPGPKLPDDVFDLAGYRKAAHTEGQEASLLRDGLKRAVESTSFPIPPGRGVTREDAQQAVLGLVEKIEGSDDDVQGEFGRDGRLAGYFLAVGSPTYRRAFAKFAMSSPAPAMHSPAEAHSIQQAKGWEQRAFTLASTGLPVPFQLDPTVIPISNSTVNPYRAISRVIQTTVKNWRGATSAGITAAYAAEGTEATDNTPTLAQPTIDAHRAQAFVPFSIEVDQDWGAVETEMLSEVADAKDDLESNKFTLGTGTNEPFGLIVGATTLVITTTTGAFVVADLYKLEEALPPRFRPRASITGNRFVLNKVRQFDSAGGAANWLPYPGVGQGLNNQVPTPGNVGYGILAYPTYENSAMDAVLTTGSEILVMGQFNPYFTIVDRIGMTADLIPHLVGTGHFPTGQRGLYFLWRNGSKVINAAAFRTLQT